MDTDRHQSHAGTALPEPGAALCLQLSEEQRIEFQKAAERCGLSLGEWMLDRLNLAAKREAKEA